MIRFALLTLVCASFVLPANPLDAKSVHRGNKSAAAAGRDPNGGDPTTRFAFRHVNFHVDDTVVLLIDELRGELLPSEPGVSPSFDDRASMVLKIDSGEAAMSTTGFATLMNRYVFNYRNTPLTDLRVSPEGNELHLTATLNRSIKTDMTGTLSATSDGRIHFHPTSIKTAGIPTKGLMDAVGLKVNKLVKGTDARGVDVQGDDLIMDLDRLLPPPRVQAHVTTVRIDGDRVVMTFGAKDATAAPPEGLDPAAARVGNYMYLRGGTVRFGKMTMNNADMQFIDAHPEDPLDFSLAHYYEQLAAGYTKTPADGALVSFIPDYRQVASHADAPDLRPPGPTPAADARTP